MPASRRHHRALAVLAHCLGVLAAVPALPTLLPQQDPPAPAPPPASAAAVAARATSSPPTGAPVAARATSTAMPSAPPPTPTPARAPLSAPPATVTVAVTSATTPAPAYRIRVRNTGDRPVRTTVRQELPSGASATTITGGGRASRTGNGPDEVTWQLTLPARASTTLQTALRTGSPGAPLAAPACAYAEDGRRPYDCGTATWTRADPATQEGATPLWRRVPVLVGALLVLVALVGAGLWWWQRHRRTRAWATAPGHPGPTNPHSPHSPHNPAGPHSPTGPNRTGSTGPTEGRARENAGTVYPVPGMGRPAQRRRTPPVWLVVGVAVAVVAGVVGAAGWVGTRQVTAMRAGQQPTSGAWVGQTVAGPVGVPLRETAFEFTVYRVVCGAATAAGRRCEATVGVRNLTPEQQLWHGRLQRAYLPGGGWVSTDELATRAVNQGRDVFAAPVGAGSRVVLPLVFSVAGREPPRQLELRSGVFSAGVRVQVP